MHHNMVITIIIFFTVGTPRYITELACGLGATVFLVICFIVVYHVYWLELVLFYRAHFGTDETIGGKILLKCVWVNLKVG